MNRAEPEPVDPRLDIVIDRTVVAPVERVWAAWTRPAQLSAWFAPAPYVLTACEVDLLPGGVFRTVFGSLSGIELHSVGCEFGLGCQGSRSLATVQSA